MSVATRSGSPQFPTSRQSMPPSSQQEMDAAVQALQEQKDAWVAVTPAERVALLDRLICDFAAIAPRWVAACQQAKGIAADSPLAGEEWALGPWPVLKNLRQLRQSLLDIEAIGHPRIPGPVKTRPDGQVVAQVFPQNIYDRLFFTGITAEIWMEPGVTVDNLAETQAVAYHDKQHKGRVALVLGAGNVSSIGPMDILYKIFVEDQVVVLKLNPINDYLGPLIEESFQTLIEPGFLRLIYGGTSEGAYLCNHPGVDEVHITGSDKTFDAIVFGAGAEGAKRKAAGQRLLAKRVTGELGNVSPVILVPGPWSEGDLAYHAEHVVSMLTNNAGFNCNATRVIITHARWPQRVAFLQHMRDIMSKLPPRVAYYPGAQDRQRMFLAAHPEAEEYGTAEEGKLPWTLIAGIDPEKADDLCFTTEAFCSLFSETALEAASITDYIERAVSFANDRLWGTLNATLIVHPASLKDPAIAAAVEQAIANLRYGTIGLNYWAGAGFPLAVTTWGAFPGHDIYDIQSGTGVVHNTLMFSQPQKSVLRAPFRTIPTPPWFATRGSIASKLFPKLTEMEASPSPWKVPSIALAALKG